MQLVRIFDPIGTNSLGDQIRQPRVGLDAPAPDGHPVGDADDLVRFSTRPVGEQVLAQNIRVQLRNAVDLMAHGQGQVSHAHLVVGNDRHIADFSKIVGIDLPKVVAVLLVDGVGNHMDAGQKLPEHLQRPALQRFAHHRMVGIGETIAGHLPGVLPGQAFLVEQNAHQLRNRQGRMGVVDVDGDLFV